MDIDKIKNVAIYLLIDEEGFVVPPSSAPSEIFTSLSSVSKIEEFVIQAQPPSLFVGKRDIGCRRSYKLDNSNYYWLLSFYVYQEGDLIPYLYSFTIDTGGRRKVCSFSKDDLDPKKNGDMPKIKMTSKTIKTTKPKSKNFLTDEELSSIKAGYGFRLKLNDMEKTYAMCSHIVDTVENLSALKTDAGEYLKCTICGKRFILSDIESKSVEDSVEHLQSIIETTKHLLSFEDLTPEERNDARELFVALEHLKLIPQLYSSLRNKCSGISE